MAVVRRGEMHIYIGGREWLLESHYTDHNIASSKPVQSQCAFCSISGQRERDCGDEVCMTPQV